MKGWFTTIGLMTIVALLFLLLVVISGCLNIEQQETFEYNLPVPNGWYIDEISYTTADQITAEWYDIYVKIRNKERPWCWTNTITRFNTRTGEVHANFGIGHYGWEGICSGD